MTESRDVVTVCVSCGLGYVEATRIGPVRLEMNPSCPRCVGRAPILMRTDQAEQGRQPQSEGDGGNSGNSTTPARLGTLT